MDTTTLLITTVMVAIATCLGMALVLVRYRRQEGLAFWVGGFVSMPIGLLLYAARGSIPEFAAVIIGNAFALGTILMMAEGLRRFHRMEGNGIIRWGVALAVLSLFGSSYFLYVNPNTSARVAVFSFTTGYLLLVAAVPPLQVERIRRMRGQLILSSTFGVWGLYSFFRAFKAIADPIEGAARTGWVGKGFLLLIILMSTTSAIGFLALAFERAFEKEARLNEEKERLIGELQSALDDVRTLSGLIPMCASCKKVRDDSGYWAQVEEYLVKRTGAEVSHGFCPECIEKLYPQFAESVLGKERRN